MRWPRTFTVNYNWTKPEVGASVDNWGGYINSDLDGIDSDRQGGLQRRQCGSDGRAGYGGARQLFAARGRGTLTGTLNATGINASANMGVTSAAPKAVLALPARSRSSQENWDFIVDSEWEPYCPFAQRRLFRRLLAALQFVRGTGYLSPTIKAIADVTFAAGVDFGSTWR